MDHWITQLIFAILVVTALFGLSAVLRRWIDVLQEKGRIPPLLVLPLRILAKWGLFVLAFLLLLQNFGFQITGIWTLISTILAMIAIGFVAVWSLLSNLSATLMILLLRPFEIGDEIEFVGEPVKGKVVSLGFFYSTLAEEDSEAVIQIPNNLFFQKNLRRTRAKGKPAEDLLDNLKGE